MQNTEIIGKTIKRMKYFIKNTRYSDIQRKLCKGIILRNEKIGDRTIKEWFELEDGYKLSYTKIIEKNGDREYYIKKYIVFTIKKEKCKLFAFYIANKNRWLWKCWNDVRYHEDITIKKKYEMRHKKKKERNRKK